MYLFQFIFYEDLFFGKFTQGDMSNGVRKQVKMTPHPAQC